VYLALKGVTVDLSFQAYKSVYHLIGNEQIVEMEIRVILLIASLQTVGALTTVFFEEKIHQIKLWYRYKRAHEKYMVVGDNKNAQALIEDICRYDDHKGRGITYYTNEKLDKDDKNFKNIRVRRQSDFLDEIPFEKGRPTGYCNIVLMLKDKNENIECLRKINEKAGAHPSEDSLFSHIRITAICNNDPLRFHNWSNMKLDIYLVSEEQLVVEKLMKEHSPIASLIRNNDLYDKDNFKVAKRGYSVCLVGFGELGQELLLSAYENSRVLTEDLSESPFHALVIDKNMKMLKHSFLADVPYLAESNYIEFLKFEFTSAK
jgi:hypothetical protein